jgi:hypothetical protein
MGERGVEVDHSTLHRWVLQIRGGFEIRIMVGVVADDRCRVGAALVDRDLLRNSMTTG